MSVESFLLILVVSSDDDMMSESNQEKRKSKAMLPLFSLFSLSKAQSPYNNLFRNSHPHLPFGKAIVSLMTEQNEIAEFYRRELAQALNEQAFGISRSEVTRFTENEAEAIVTLLEGMTINVVLSSAGYKVWRQGHLECCLN